MRFLIIILNCFTILTSFGQTVKTKVVHDTVYVHDRVIVHDTITVHKMDTIVAIPQPSADERYINLLEKVNTQVSLIHNPYGILITVLGVLFGILAIVVTIIIFAQTREFQKLIRNLIYKGESIINQFVDDKKKQLETFEFTINNLIEGYKEKLLTINDNDNVIKDQIMEKIKQLEKQKEEIEEQRKPEVVRAEIEFQNFATGFQPMGAKVHKCSKCGFGFKVQDDFGFTTGSVFLGSSMMGTGMKKTVTCPSCSNIDIL